MATTRDAATVRWVEVRFYADLIDLAGGRERTVPIGAPRSVKDAVESCGVPHPEIALLLVDGYPVGFEHRVYGGERIAVYPPFRRLELAGVTTVEPPPVAPRFVLDVHLGTLTRRLRLLGIDCWYRTDADDERLARVAVDDGRILLTRDRGLLMRRVITHGHCPRSDDPEEQALEVVRRYGLGRDVAPLNGGPHPRLRAMTERWWSTTRRASTLRDADLPSPDGPVDVDQGGPLMTSIAPSTSHRMGMATVVATVAALILALAPFRPAVAQDPPFSRGIDRACLDGARTADPFADVSPDATHGAAIACVWAYGVAQGRFVDAENVYDPQDPVTRQQMASFIARSLDTLPGAVYMLPDPREDALFDDADRISSAHILSVNQLADAGIVRGFTDGTFRPQEDLDRAQMASFVVRAIEDVTGNELARAPVFDDVSGTHQAAIEKLAAIGVAQGRAEGVYAPDDPITRAQMASFLARTLDHLVAEGLLQPLAFDAGTAPATLGLVDVDAAIREGFDRVTFTFEGDERQVGYRVQYVDEATAVGTGDPIDVAGDAILRVILTGLAFPPDLPVDLEEQVMEVLGSQIDVGGDGIVEVVIGSVFEGQLQIFIGTTGLRPFEVDRLEDPQRVFIDVDHVG